MLESATRGATIRLRARSYSISYLAWALIVLVGLLGAGCGEQQQEQPPLPVTGELLFNRHCASCHGLGGEGDGPMAASLERRPTDLTALSESAGGRFDEAVMMRMIDGRREVAAHGPREMPVWGAVFEAELEEERHGSYAAMLHVRALTDYLRTLQRER